MHGVLKLDVMTDGNALSQMVVLRFMLLLN